MGSIFTDPDQAAIDALNAWIPDEAALPPIVMVSLSDGDVSSIILPASEVQRINERHYRSQWSKAADAHAALLALGYTINGSTSLPSIRADFRKLSQTDRLIYHLAAHDRLDKSALQIVLFSDFIISDDIQSRAALSPEKVAEYAAIYREGGKLPAITLFKTPEGTFLSDGFTRTAGAKDAGLDRLPANIVEGTKRDAFLYSISANRKHGLPPNAADKRHAAEHLLRDPDWSKWSDREIERRTGYNRSSVGVLRAEIEVERQQAGQLSDPDSGARTYMRDGRVQTMHTSSIGRGSRVGAPNGDIPEATDPPSPEESQVAPTTLPDLNAAQQEVLTWFAGRGGWISRPAILEAGYTDYLNPLEALGALSAVYIGAENKYRITELGLEALKSSESTVNSGRESTNDLEGKTATSRIDPGDDTAISNDIVSDDSTASPDDAAVAAALSPSPDEDKPLDIPTTASPSSEGDKKPDMLPRGHYRSKEEATFLHWLCDDERWHDEASLKPDQRQHVITLLERGLILRRQNRGMTFVHISDLGYEHCGFGGGRRVVQPLEDFLAGKPAPKPNINGWMKIKLDQDRAAALEARRAAAAERDTPGARMRDRLKTLPKLETCWRVVAHQDGTFTAAFDLDTIHDMKAAREACTRYGIRMEIEGFRVSESGVDLDPTLSFAGVLTPMVRFRVVEAGSGQENRRKQAFSVLISQKDVEYYTRPEHLDLVRRVFDSDIDLDPASCAIANTNVRAARFFAVEDDGLSQDWIAENVFLNPPYGTDEDGSSNQARWLNKLIEEYHAGHTDRAILHCKAATAEAWFEPLWEYPICFVRGRIRFLVDQDGVLVESKAGIAGGNVFVLFDTDPATIVRFEQAFEAIGKVIIPDALRDDLKEDAHVLTTAAAD